MFSYHKMGCLLAGSYGHQLQFRYRKQITVEFQWFEHLWNDGNMFETEVQVVPANEFNHIARSGGIQGIYFQFSLI